MMTSVPLANASPAADMAVPLVALDASVEACKFAFSGFQADLKALDFAEPAVHPCFGDALAQVADDVGEAGPLLR